MDDRIKLRVEQHEVGSEKQDWWMLQMDIDGKWAMGFGFSTKRDAENALSVANYFAEKNYQHLNSYKGI